MKLSELTWEEAKAFNAKLILLPIGSIEQHGYHLPLNNDTFVAEKLAGCVASSMNARGCPTLVAPSIPVGLSGHHMAFYGSLTLSTETFQAVVREVCISLGQHGLRNIIIVNGHGGNSAALRKAIASFPSTIQASLLEYWRHLTPDSIKEIESAFFCHACEGETSLSLALGQLAHMDRAVCNYPTGDYSAYNLLNGTGEINGPLPPIHTISPSGVIGDSTLANKLKGERILSALMPEMLATLTDRLELCGHGK